MSKSDYMDANQLMNHLNNEYGKNTVMRASEAKALQKVLLSTGCVDLDIMLGGGIQEGRIHQFRGNFSCAKTTHMLHCARSYLAIYSQAIFVFIDAEGTTDVGYLEIIGFDDDMLERTILVNADNGEKYCDVALEACRKGQKIFVGLDSIDALVPKDEAEADQDKQSVGLGARMINKFMRKLVPIIKTELDNPDPRITFVYLCQLREKVGVTFGSPDTTWGGKGKEFAAASIIKFARISFIREGTKASGGMVVGAEIQAELIKIKGPGQGEITKYSLAKANTKKFSIGEFDNIAGLMNWGIRLKIIKQRAKTLEYGDLSVVGKANFCDAVREDVGLTAMLMSECMSARRAFYSGEDETVSINSAFPWDDAVQEQAKAQAKPKTRAKAKPKTKRASRLTRA